MSSSACSAYKRIADINDAEEAEKIRGDLADRYGPPPEAVETLVQFALLKTKAQHIGVEAIDRRGGALNIKFHPASKIDPAAPHGPGLRLSPEPNSPPPASSACLCRPIRRKPPQSSTSPKNLSTAWREACFFICVHSRLFAAHS